MGFLVVPEPFLRGSVCCHLGSSIHKMERSAASTPFFLPLCHDTVHLEWTGRFWKSALRVWCQFWVLCLWVCGLCVLCLVSTSLVHYIPRGFLEGGGLANGRCVLLRDEGCRVLRWGLGVNWLLSQTIHHQDPFSLSSLARSSHTTSGSRDSVSVVKKVETVPEEKVYQGTGLLSFKRCVD